MSMKDQTMPQADLSAALRNAAWAYATHSKDPVLAPALLALFSEIERRIRAAQENDTANRALAIAAEIIPPLPQPTAATLPIRAHHRRAG